MCRARVDTRDATRSSDHVHVLIVHAVGKSPRREFVI